VPDTDPAAILARWREAEKAAMDHDGPTVVLEHIRDGAEAEIVHPDDECGISAGGFCTPHAALRLVAAVETTLAHHAEAVIEDMPDPFRYCKTCSGHPAWPCPEVRDITAALAGKEAGDD
jgi:hypothetical protein